MNLRGRKLYETFFEIETIQSLIVTLNPFLCVLGFHLLNIQWLCIKHQCLKTNISSEFATTAVKKKGSQVRQITF